MLTALTLTIGFFTMRRKLMPEVGEVASKVSERRATSLEMHLYMRDLLPAIAFGGAGNVALLALILHVFGLFQISPDLAAGIVSMMATLQTGLLAGFTIKAAEKLVEGEQGKVNQDLRVGVFPEFVVFPLLPVIASIAILV